jgi:hypothetical protein
MTADEGSSDGHVLASIAETSGALSFLFREGGRA